MEKEKEEPVAGTAVDTQKEEPVPPRSKREELNALLSGEISGYDASDDEASAGMLLDYVNGNIEQRTKFAEALQEDPRLAQVLADIVGKRRGAGEALARYYGKELLMAEEGSPEYEAIQKAEEERKSEMKAFEARSKEYNDNLEKSMPIVEEWCKEKGYDTNEFLDRVWNLIVAPIMSGSYSRELCDLLDKGMNYDKDTADAMKAGIVKGHNDNINRMREETGDGLPKGMSSVPAPRTPKKTKRSPLIEAALNA